MIVHNLAFPIACASVLAVGGFAGGQVPGVEPEPVQEADSVGDIAYNDDPGFYVRAEVDRPDRAYREGDPLAVRALSEADALLYIFYQQADGRVFQIFPNRQQPDNRVRAGQEVTIPGQDDLFRWRVGAPFGQEVIKVIASKRPIFGLDDPALREKRFNPVSLQRLRKAAGDLAEGPPRDWTEHDIQIVTSRRERAEPPAPTRPPPDAGPSGPGAATGKRIGVFFGVDEFRYNPQIVAYRRWLVQEGLAEIPPELVEQGLSLQACRNDGVLMGVLMKQKGRLDDARVFIGEEATRDRMEEMITRWLPSATQPGDTVFIYISSHGGQAEDDDGDEARSNPGDTMDEYVLPHDFASGPALWELRCAEQAGQDVGEQARGWIDLVGKQLGDWPDRDGQRPAYAAWEMKADAILARRSGITDDEFGHWLQRLDGRQVVLILDICYSGGFAIGERGISGRGTQSFDFLDRELTRLKDLGQRESALLSASGAGQLARTRALVWDKDQEPSLPDGILKIRGDEGETIVPVGVMTVSLLTQLEGATGPTDLETAFRACEAQMKEYFDEMNEALRATGKPEVQPHQPRLYNFCTNTVFIVP